MSLPVHLNLDTDEMRACMGLWRQSLILPDQGAGDGEDRRATLARVNRALDGWLDLLRLCSVEPSEAHRLADIRREVIALRDWTHEAGLALRLLAGAATVDAQGSSRRKRAKTGRKQRATSKSGTD
jgi:hypothetical protein